ALDAHARRLLPLPQPRRLDAEGACAPLEARTDEGRAEGRQARGAGRRLRIDCRAEILSRKLHPRLIAAQSLRASSTPSPTVTRHASTRESSRIFAVRLRRATVSGFWSAGSATVPLQSILSMAIS